MTLKIFHFERNVVVKINIKAIKLDSINFNPNIKIVSLKIDTEGEDFSVLEGSKNLIKTNMPNLVIETRQNNIDKILNFMNSLGYKNIYDKFNKRFGEEEIYKFENNKNVKDIFCNADLVFFNEQSFSLKFGRN